MLDWNRIETVFLDMDGTLLDLNFDNHFWLEFVPQRYADLHGLSLIESKKILQPLFKNMEGKLEWYCLDYWSEQLNLNIAGLKAEIAGLISVLPHVSDFLTALQNSNKRVFLVTNAHPDSLSLKMEHSCLHSFFDEIVCSHTLGFAKENQQFWSSFQQQYHWQTDSSVMIDDSLAVLNSAERFGIEHLIAMNKPDSQQDSKNITQYPAIQDFRALLPIL